MIEPKPLTDRVSVSAFVPPAELAELAARFRTVINNRPDGEEAGQAPSAAIEAEAERLGLAYVHLPVTPGQISDRQVEAFAQAIADHEGPILAFCRTGMRSATLCALSQAGAREMEAVIAAAARAGYDLSALRPRLGEKASAS